MTLTFSLTLVWPADTLVALPRGRWRQLDDGRYEARYLSHEELDYCMEPARVNGDVPRTEAGRWAEVRHWLRSLKISADREQMDLIGGIE